MQSSGHSKLANLDVLRSIAAFNVVLFHYPQFFQISPGVQADDFQLQTMPLYALFPWGYQFGAWMVHFFWMLSGFIFYRIYADRRSVSARSFFAHRVARLYPLHIITLLVVAVLQWLSQWQLQRFLIVGNNDAWHFFLNLFMASSWGLEQGYSFNGPIWSVSVEVLVYALFFVFLKRVGVRLGSSLMGFVLLFVLLNFSGLHAQVLDCAALFATGGLVSEVDRQLRARFSGNFNTALAALACAAALLRIGSSSLPPSVLVHWLLYPSVMWLAAALDARGISSGRVGLALGSLTYGSYLIHVPVQIALVLVMDVCLHSRALAMSPYFFCFYFACVGALAALSSRYIEGPLQKICLRRLEITGPTPA